MSIKEALGLGEKFKLKSGTTIKVVPCSLADLEEAQERWERLLKSRYSLQGLYSSKNKDNADVQEARADLEWLLIKAAGQEVPEDDGARRELVKPLLKPFNVNDYGEVFDYFSRFLGYVTVDTTADPLVEEPNDAK